MPFCEIVNIKINQEKLVIICVYKVTTKDKISWKYT